MNGASLASTLAAAFGRLAESGDELRELDAAVGDGDLGVTVVKGAAEVRSRLATLPPDVRPTDVVLAMADAFGNANPSTFALLVSRGLVAGARAIGDVDEFTTTDSVTLGRAAADAIMRRGKSAVGDKTLLDALVPSLDAAELHSSDGAAALESAIAAAAAGIAGVTDIAARKGRAAWAGERGIGIPDPGATAYLRFLEAMRESLTDQLPTDPDEGEAQ